MTEQQTPVGWVGVLLAIVGSRTPRPVTKHGGVVIRMVCDQQPQSSCGCSRYESKVACSCTATSGFVDSHDFIANFAVPGIVIRVLVPVAR